MSLYLEQIRQLVALQRVDDAIHSVETELEQAPKDLEELKARFAATDAQRERVLEKIAHLKEQEKRINGEIDDDSSRIKKSKSKMMQVSNSREYQAMAREMDNMEKVNRSREEERSALMEEKMHQDSALQEVDAVWAARPPPFCRRTSRRSWRRSRSVWKRVWRKPGSVWRNWPMSVPKPVPPFPVPCWIAMNSSAVACPIR